VAAVVEERYAQHKEAERGDEMEQAALDDVMHQQVACEVRELYEAPRTPAVHR
jgi:hypothetical protein